MGLLVYLDLLEVSEKQALKYELVQKIKSINWFLVWMLTSFVLFFIAMAYYFAGLPEKEKERRWAIWVAAACVVSFLGSMVCT
ncbi:hypothetical protein L228DRAFT_246069 [Xylona heveae TC161]|uniref:Uncharacterized protein n=1 Tax=Xylona heveae (strain CBS 132557 / TC161) TaxID=1328760 RepID=A0A165HCQ2_XYLHT|nr:hypothetical protein L228DRAFT_246069 [Xylona heveae TC161]KZF23310.1 hypothetical protein L228DRAFT_246069 [Xylona heveae TC161]